MMTDEDRRVLQETHDAVIEIKTSLEKTEQDVEDHSHTLYGNGTPGLKIRVDRLEQAAEPGKVWKVAWVAGFCLVFADVIVRGAIGLMHLVPKG